MAVGVTLGCGALAETPEGVYWRARIEAIARLAALANEKADPEVIGKVEAVAQEALRRKIFEIVGPVKVGGFEDRPQNHVSQLSEGPDFGLLDGVSFATKDKRGVGELIVTTKPLLRLWLKEEAQRSKGKWAESIAGALRADAFYGDALDPEIGFLGVVDIGLNTPEVATFAAAKLGRSKDVRTDSSAPPQLVVTVVKGRFVLIAVKGLSTAAIESAECASMVHATGSENWGGASVEEERPAWVKCERRKLPGAPAFQNLKREAQAMAERLARAQ